MELSNWQWALLGLGAFFTGLSKTGVAGLGILPVALFANALPARESTGALLPLLIAADVFGVAIFRKHADWAHLWKLFPWVVVGVVCGYFALDLVSGPAIQGLIGWIIVVMVGLHFWRQRQKDDLAAKLP